MRWRHPVQVEAIKRAGLYVMAVEMLLARETDGKDQDGMRALGFDVEYSTLGEDLRGLPAMLQLAANGVVALVWLDKLPDHGRGLLAKSNPLRRLLADSSVLKVGVGSSNDAWQLLGWCGEPGDSVGGIVDLNTVAADPEVALGLHEESAMESKPESDPDEDLRILLPERASLATWCEEMLKKRLLKHKFRGSKQSAAARASHWRVPHLTPDQTSYASNDVAVALDVWQALTARVYLTNCCVAEMDLSQDVWLK
ncbi:hypothetical protein CYMTET_28369 [Cymbomonas tetramitiformis]|uniref:3'-5' exonuclease n=1 Tax=Cymbomonas tetramitiformis TaxID=36881 RepID=A0AAE0FNA0_9CHLO|nr:hypothetical protein CYMTET_28369 [Cymbomonas tetramitiformis]